MRVEVLRADGADLQSDDPVLNVSGSAASILTAERTALNFIQRLSGVRHANGGASPFCAKRNLAGIRSRLEAAGKMPALL